MKLIMENWRKFIKEEDSENPCWEGYQMVGTKMKDGKEVPNCVPNDSKELDEGVGKSGEKKTAKDKMPCNKPRYIKKGEPGYGKKQKVVKACENGQEKIIRFGDANMENLNYNDDARRNFRARHNCDEEKSKLTAGYWSCKDW